MTRWGLLTCLVLASCESGAVRPAHIVLGRDACASCRMVIVSELTAAQIVAPGEEPRFFDEIGCLRDDLERTPLPPGAQVYVADHRTHGWVDARVAVFTRTSASTPMRSGLIAHRDTISRDADPASSGGQLVDASSILHSPSTRNTP